MEILVRLFPYCKTIAWMRQAWDQTDIYKDSTAARTRRKLANTVLWSSLSLVMMQPGVGCRGYEGDGPCSLFQTQAAQTVLQSREAPVMPRMAILLGFMGIGMSGYSSRQLTQHYKPSSHLFR